MGGSACFCLREKLGFLDLPMGRILLAYAKRGEVRCGVSTVRKGVCRMFYIIKWTKPTGRQ